MHPHVRSPFIGRASLLVVLGAIAGPAASAPLYHLVDLGADTAANDINRHGVVAGSRQGHAAMRRADGWHARAGADSVRALDGQGEATGLGLTPDRVYYSVYWAAGGGSAVPVTMPFNAVQVLALDVESGRVAGYAEDDTFRAHCFVWTPAGGGVDLGTGARGNYCYAYDINESGQLVGSTLPPEPFAQEQGFIWQDGVFTFLGTLPGGHWSEANAINRQGHVAMTADRLLANGQGAWRPVLWTGTRLKDLGTIDRSRQAQALHINDRDEVVGEYWTADLGWRPFLYSEGQLYPIESLVDNLGAVDIGIPRAIADDGTIVGTFIDEQRVTHAYRLERVATSGASDASAGSGNESVR